MSKSNWKSFIQHVTYWPLLNNNQETIFVFEEYGIEFFQYSLQLR